MLGSVGMNNLVQPRDGRAHVWVHIKLAESYTMSMTWARATLTRQASKPIASLAS